MRRYAVFTARFVFVPMISGCFVVSASGRAAGIEWAHIIAGYLTVYLVLGLLLLSAKYPDVRLPAAVALGTSLVEAIPGVPQLHAVASPVLFATLVWALMNLPTERKESSGGKHFIFIMPALVLLPAVYGAGYRHQTSGFAPHVITAMTVAGIHMIVAMVLSQRYSTDQPMEVKLRSACTLTITAVLFQLAFGIITFIIRLLEIDGGVWLAFARTAHITGAAPLLGASTTLAIQYRRSVRDFKPVPPLTFG